MARLTLRWPHGYHYRIEHHPAGTGPTLAQQYDAYDELVREGAAVEAEIKADVLYERFANTRRNAEGMKAFAETFGLLWTRSPRESVEAMLIAQRELRKLLAAKKRDDWEAATAWLKDRPKVATLAAIIGQDNQGRHQLEYQPQHLFGFMVMQLIRDWSRGATYRWCERPGCDEWFYYGPGTEHRETARYHSPQCQAAHAYDKRKGQSK